MQRIIFIKWTLTCKSELYNVIIIIKIIIIVIIIIIIKIQTADQMRWQRGNIWNG